MKSKMRQMVYHALWELRHNQKKSLKEIGIIFDRDKERIRQILARIELVRSDEATYPKKDFQDYYPRIKRVRKKQ